MSSLAEALHAATEPYAERQIPEYSRLDRLYQRLIEKPLSAMRLSDTHYRRQIENIGNYRSHFEGLSDTALRDSAIELRRRLRREGLTEENVATGFALIREVSRRTTGMRHYDVQLRAGLVMLDGAIAEMQTGEGKTLSVSLPAALVAMSGVPVHVITVNDYLAARDVELMRPIYEFFDLSVGSIVSTTNAAARRDNYHCDVVYCANNEIVFDYLRDRLVLGNNSSASHLQFQALYGTRSNLNRLLLQGLRFAIVDEADSVLVDETRTPLILSAPGADDGRAEVVHEALAMQQQLARDRDFILDRTTLSVTLTDAGREAISTGTENLGGVWNSHRLGEHLVKQAIAATYLFVRDEHYVVRDGKVLIVDPHTGRVMPGRTWSEGMHQFVEAKEDCEITPDPNVLARVSYQSFFRRYLALSGMTGTAREVTDELWNVYDLDVAVVPPRVASRRRFTGRQVLPTAEGKWRAVVDAVTRAHSAGRPVLIGTSSVATSEHLSGLLHDASLPHELLNAKQDSREAEIIAGAGAKGRITVATNMAGRGTDIRLGPSVADLGGLHVIVTEYHDAARIDRQLIGRCARQGDPGSYEVIASLEDPIVESAGAVVGRLLVPLLRRTGAGVVSLAGPAVLRAAQRRIEKQHSRMRQRLLQADETVNSRLAFAGRAE